MKYVLNKVSLLFSNNVLCKRRLTVKVERWPTKGITILCSEFVKVSCSSKSQPHVPRLYIDRESPYRVSTAVDLAPTGNHLTLTRSKKRFL